MQTATNHQHHHHHHHHRHHHLVSNGAAFRHQQEQMHSYPTQQQYNTPNAYSTSTQMYARGKKPSLAAFDPFSSPEAAASPVSPMGRDSSPAVKDHSDPQRQPVTPPSTGRPIATNYQTRPSNDGFNDTYNYNTPLAIRDSFDNEKTTSRNPVAKTVNKFLRKLGHHSPNSSGHNRRVARDSNTTASKGAVKAESSTRPVARESNDGTKTVTPAIDETKIAAIDSDKSKTSMAHDLMELKEEFGSLQIPSLMVKSSPTSFLMGTGNEAVTTNCSNEPTPFQLEIPSLSEVVTMARLNEFVENYRRHDQNLDLKQFVGLDRMDLQHKIDNSLNTNNKSGDSSNTMVPEHVPIIESLLECSEGQEQEISIQGFLTEAGNLHSDSRVEAVIFQGQRNFTVIFRGTTEQQSRVLGNSKSKKRAVPLDSKNETAEVYSGFLESYSKVEEKCFRTIDKLVDENPFCDFNFSGYSFGAALATLAAVRYAKARPMMRVGCLTLASPKVGFSHFRHVVNTTPNLKVVRLELGGHMETKCQGPTVGGWHVGHTLVLNSSNISNGSSGSSKSASPTSNEEQQPSVSVYKFEAPNKHKTTGFFKTSNPCLKKYISALEDLATLENNRYQAAAASNGKAKRKQASPWPRDFANNAGKGVIVNKEERLVV